jgi:CHAD domain-containing protein
MSGATSIESASDAAAKSILELSQKRLEKFASLFPRVLIRDDPETIHDVRVWSRRLQQILRVLFPKPATKKSRKLVRMLRRVRRALGDCRNLDVIGELIQEKIVAAGNPVVRDAWDHLKVHIQDRRQAELLRAREKLSQYDIVDFVNRTQALLSRADSSEDLKRTLNENIAQARKDWEAAVDQARQSPEPEQLHALRIAGKRLRYRLELVAELGENSAGAQIKALKTIQDQFGQWHDRYVLSRFVGAFLGRKHFLADHPGLSRALLLEVERERRRNDAAVTNILQSAEKIRQSWTGEVAVPVESRK